MLVDLGRNDVGKVTDGAPSFNNGQQSTSCWWSKSATRCWQLKFLQQVMLLPAKHMMLM